MLVHCVLFSKQQGGTWKEHHRWGTETLSKWVGRKKTNSVCLVALFFGFSNFVVLRFKFIDGGGRGGHLLSLLVVVAGCVHLVPNPIFELCSAFCFSVLLMIVLLCYSCLSLVGVCYLLDACFDGLCAVPR